MDGHPCVEKQNWIIAITPYKDQLKMHNDLNIKLEIQNV